MQKTCVYQEFFKVLTWCIINIRLHFIAIFKYVSTAISLTPGKASCMNSNSLLTTVFKNFQWALRNLGYWPTTYIIFEAMTALFPFPLVVSQRSSRFLITFTRNADSKSSFMEPDMDPIAQHNRLSPFQDSSASWGKKVNLGSSTRGLKENERRP